MDLLTYYAAGSGGSTKVRGYRHAFGKMSKYEQTRSIARLIRLALQRVRDDALAPVMPGPCGEPIPPMSKDAR
jgi:hypothetical protein